MKAIIQRLTGQKAFEKQTVIQHVFEVKNLSSFDMIYIYHHIKEGTKLSLIQKGIQLNGDFHYQVYYQNFLLGHIRVNANSIAKFESKLYLDSTVINVSKEKYLPIKNLDIAINHQAMRLVS